MQVLNMTTLNNITYNIITNISNISNISNYYNIKIDKDNKH